MPKPHLVEEVALLDVSASLVSYKLPDDVRMHKGNS